MNLVAAVSDERALYAVLAVYLAYVAWHWGRTSPRKAPRPLVAAYNLAVSAWSLVFALLLAQELRATMAATPATMRIWRYTEKVYFVGCFSGNTPHLMYLYALSLAVRVVELLDTVLVVHSTQPLTFLHTFHHAATIWLAHVHVVEATPFQWATLGVNAFVHIVMYFYHFLRAMAAARGLEPPSWKRLVTILQIMQFVLLLTVYGTAMPAWLCGECYATPRAVYSAFAVLSAYLVLFARFYWQTYVKIVK